MVNGYSKIYSNRDRFEILYDIARILDVSVKERLVEQDNKRKMSFQKTLDKYRKMNFSSETKATDLKGDASLSATDPKYASKFKNVWMWNEF